jgi:hypothetical protein
VQECHEVYTAYANFGETRFPERLQVNWHPALHQDTGCANKLTGEKLDKRMKQGPGPETTPGSGHL